MFDLVVAYMCLHDMDQMPQAVAEAARVLERGGRPCVEPGYPVNSAGLFQGRDGDAPCPDRKGSTWSRPRRLSGRTGRHQLTFHSEHRPIEAYSRALEAAGLLIEAIRETGAPDGVVTDAPGNRRWQRIPLFLHLRAVKPAGARTVTD